MNNLKAKTKVNHIRNNLTAIQIIKTLKEHSDILKKYRVKKIGLFGSYATGKQSKHSDLDFIVDFEKPNFNNFMDLAFYLEDLFGRDVDILTPAGVKDIRIKEIANNIKRSIIYA